MRPFPRRYGNCCLPSMNATVVEQRALFDDVQTGPPGLRYELDCIGLEEERELLEAIESLPFHEAEYRGYTAKRRVVSYGAGYDFDAKALHAAPAMPRFLHPLRARVERRLGLSPCEITHALVTEYRPGTQLGWHRDAPDFEMVMGISLGTPCRMRFRPYPPQRGERAFVLDLAPRSMYALSGAARWKWQHGILPTPGLRYSITFRTIAEGARKPASDV